MKRNDILTTLCEQALDEQDYIHNCLFSLSCGVTLTDEQLSDLNQRSMALRGYLEKIQRGGNND